MVARGDKNRCLSPCLSTQVELDNKALKAKNNGLIQTVTKLQQENAELSKQVTFLQGESFELKSRYNNLKNVISIIDSTTKTCLPKLNEVVDTFTGIIQLCSVASNISSSNRDTRTQAVKPQIVNGHVLHNPTITLSRLDNDEASYTPPRASTSRISSNIVIRPSTSRGSNDGNRDRNLNLNCSQNENDGENSNENEDMEPDSSFVCQATRGVYRRRSTNMDMSRLQEEQDLESSEEELEMPLPEEDAEENQSDQRLSPIEEDEEDDEEEEEEASSHNSPRSRQRRFLKGRLQEVRIYLNQLPPTYIEQFMGSGNISISVSPPEGRTSYQNRSSSLVGESNGTFLDENISLVSTIRMDDCKLEENPSLNNSRSKVSVTFKGSSPMKSPTHFESGRSNSTDGTLQFSNNLSPIHNLPPVTPRTSNGNNSSDMTKLSLQEFSLVVPSDDSRQRTSTPIVPRRSGDSLFNRSGNFNRSSKSETALTFSTNVTKRKIASREKKKVAHVLLDRLSGERIKSDSPHEKIKDIVKSPLITKRSEMKTRSKGKTLSNGANSGEVNVENNAGTSEQRKNSKIKKEPPSPLLRSPLKNSPRGRPKRAARPTMLKEPNLHKKMRRSK